MQLATTAEAGAGTLATKAVTPAGLTAGARLRISTNTTIYVATTGSDTTGDGSSSAPYASLAKALSSIAGRAIDAGVTVTIQLADGTYTVSSAITIDHPDGDKIQILGNTTAETTVAIATIDTGTKTLTVSGDYSASLLAGHTFRIMTGTAANCGAYTVASCTYSGGVTSIVTNEALSSSTVGSAYITIMPANKVVLSFASGINGFALSNGVFLGLLSGMTLKTTGTTKSGIYCAGNSYMTSQYVVVNGFSNGIQAALKSGILVLYSAIVNNAFCAVRTTGPSYCDCNNMAIGNSATFPIYSDYFAFARAVSCVVCNCGNSNVPSPAFGAVGNNNAYNANT